jgi:chromosome segregation ATPase
MPVSAASPFDAFSRRLAVYGYLAPLLAGRRVIEVGLGAGTLAGDGAARLRALGASAVLGLDTDAQAVTRARSNKAAEGLDFRVLDRRVLDTVSSAEIVIVPEGAGLLQPGAAVTIESLRGLCRAGGQLAIIVESSDRPGGRGVGYYEINEALSAAFPRVRMFGLTPFAAFGVAEFSETPAGLRIDGGLVDEGSEQPSHYLAVAGPALAESEEEDDLGYALMQVMAEPPPSGEAPRSTANLSSSSSSASADVTDLLTDLRHRLAEAAGKTEGLLRVSRAQVEEIEELRARLRRGAESRAELDQEMTRLRRALAEADESVLDLTRRTTQEMASLAQRITAGLRTDVGGERDDSTPLARLREELRRREEELAAAESSLSERDERVAALEAEKQDLDWRLAAAQAATRSVVGGPRLVSDDSAAQRQREIALEQYRHAAAAHLEEVGRLREALAEQSTLVAELEESVASSAAKQAAAEQETERLRRHVTEVEEADRARRSRLAEVEGTLLRLQRQTALAASARAEASPPAVIAPSAPAPAGPSVAEWEQRLQTVNDEWRRKVDALTEQLNVRGGDNARLEESMHEILQLREALERVEEQLWETKGQLLLDRERMAVLEHELSTGPSEPTVTEAAHQSIMNAVYKELADLEHGVRSEISRLELLESTIESWRNDTGKSGDPTVETDIPLLPVE